MFWEKKIQLERETQAAIDPEHGQPELKGMKKEIHRMQLRLKQLKRQQESMVLEMERSIGKQQGIKLQHVSAKSRKHTTHSTLKKNIVDLKANLKRDLQDAKRVESEIKKQSETNDVLLERLEELQNEYGAYEDQKIDIGQSVELKLFQKDLVSVGSSRLS